jgi:hypothetical protein
VNEKIVKLKSDQILNKNEWKMFKNSRSCFLFKKGFNKRQIEEDEIIKKLSEQLIVDNYNRNPTYTKTIKSPNGYKIQRRCCFKNQHLCKWPINIDRNINEANLSCDSQCNHTAQKKLES